MHYYTRDLKVIRICFIGSIKRIAHIIFLWTVVFHVHWRGCVSLHYDSLSDRGWEGLKICETFTQGMEEPLMHVLHSEIRSSPFIAVWTQRVPSTSTRVVAFDSVNILKYLENIIIYIIVKIIHTRTNTDSAWTHWFQDYPWLPEYTLIFIYLTFDRIHTDCELGYSENWLRIPSLATAYTLSISL